MAALRVIVVVFWTLVQTSSADSSGLRASPASAPGIDAKLVETVRALDTNGNGKVDMSELTSFAKSQGLSTEEVLEDFKALDVNNDGGLDSSEIGPLFGAGNPAETAVSTAAVAKPTALAIEPAKSIATVAQVEPQPSEKTVPRSRRSVGLDLVALERDAQEQAGGVVASRLAERAQVLLARSDADERKAEAFDAAVHSLRANATALARQASEETREAARAASSTVSQKSMAQLKKLQVAEHKAEAAADDQREQAKLAMGRVRKAQASLRRS